MMKKGEHIVLQWLGYFNEMAKGFRRVAKQPLKYSDAVLPNRFKTDRNNVQATLGTQCFGLEPEG